MRAAVFVAPGDIELRDVPDPRIEEPTDAVVRITHAAVCGSDLWFWRGINRNWKDGWRTGHEFVGVIDAVGSEVRTLRPGDRVVVPFSYSCGECEFCGRGNQGSCLRGGGFGGPVGDGGQGEAARVPFADATAVRIPEALAERPEGMRAAVLLTDVLPTGYHGCVRAQVRAGEVAAVIGDGAVGLCAVAAARHLGAERVIAVGHHPDRLALALRMGATDIVDSREEGTADRIMQMTAGGCHSVVEAVGYQSSMDTAVHIVRPGATISFVGVPRKVETVDLLPLFSANVNLAGALAPVRAHLDPLMGAVLHGRIDATALLDMTVPLTDVAQGYRAMDERRAIKVMVEVG